MKIGMTGNRTSISDAAISSLKTFLSDNQIIEAHHGDCVGADQKFHEIMTEYGIKTVIHPPKNDKMRAYCKGDVIHPEKEYIARNHAIVDDTDMLIAFPSTKTEVLKSGTWATVRYARKKDKKILILYP